MSDDGLTKPLYEAHITYDAQDREVLEEKTPKGWKFSAIDGDPTLGQKVYCYLTSYGTSLSGLFLRMDEVVKAMWLPVPVRQKIERIVYDSKTGRNEIEGLR